jgi:DNA-binding transcriptional regulator YdaS (Cro superfamily)
LQRAAEAMGGDENLARALGVTPGQLQRWSSGAEAPSIAIFCAALDIVAVGRVADGPKTLLRAVEIAGGTAKLCRDLRLDPHALELWLRGRATPPAHVLNAVIDLILQHAAETRAAKEPGS